VQGHRLLRVDSTRLPSDYGHFLKCYRVAVGEPRVKAIPFTQVECKNAGEGAANEIAAKSIVD